MIFSTHHREIQNWNHGVHFQGRGGFTGGGGGGGGEVHQIFKEMHTLS